MLDRGLQPTVATFNVLMNGFCMSGMLEDGERLLKWILANVIVPNAGTYNSLMKPYCIRNNMRTTTDMYRSMCAGENCLVGKPKNEDTQLNLVWLSIEIFWTEIVSFGFSDLASRHSVVELELGVMSREDAGALASQKETTKATDPEGQLKTESH
ncbi:PREDICTED: pentatricopeptide [Prunus dulcis]|uniref:PREDICTED: pentatricopeptide n=1 Tax=Prunus dulcis TaxID=3755 RepID=A0A5E4FHX5_PRUDU|nr:PREDICTED: pentatricopeptide [Prunus dulcis]